MVIRKGTGAAGFDKALQDEGRLRLAVELGPAADGARVALAPGAVSVVHGPFPDDVNVAGFSVFEAGSRETAVDELRRRAIADAADAADAAGAGGTTYELRETGCPGGCPTVLQPDASEAGQRWVILLRSSAMTEADTVPPQAALDTLNAFNAREAQAGVLLAGDGLKSTARGVRVRAQGPRAAAVMDGPFTEAKELIAGFWMFRAASLDDAIEWARGVPYPTGPHVEVEIRRVVPAAGITLDELHADGAMRAEQLDAALRTALAAPAAWR